MDTIRLLVDFVTVFAVTLIVSIIVSIGKHRFPSPLFSAYFIDMVRGAGKQRSRSWKP